MVGLSVVHVKSKGLHRTTSNLNWTEIGVTSFQAITCGTEKNNSGEQLLTAKQIENVDESSDFEASYD